METTFFTIILACLASSGLWGFLTFVLQNRLSSKDAKSQMILGLGHDRIMFLCAKYIDRGHITQDEYENLYEYLYKPYKELGGNGSAEKMMTEVNKLPIRIEKGE